AQNPSTSSWEQVCEEATDALRKAATTANLDQVQQTHRRGSYGQLVSGISFGGGQKVVGNLRQPSREADHAVRELLGNDAIRRIASMQSSILKAYAPRMYQLYDETLSSLLKHHPNLTVNFERSVFSAIGFNVGPRTVTFPHSDHLNLAGGWCVITPLGHFNSKAGGHIVLRQLGIAVELPVGSSIAITSAVVEHFNTDIDIDETRMSITQFSPAGIFRWIENSFRTNKD
ncbi:hypothetical protein BDN71DRAFT_1353453, partial [Pleurotus eryngii]